MTISTAITAELASLQAQVVAAAPLSNASHATIKALQLNAGNLVADIQAALIASSLLDTFVAAADPISAAIGVVAVMSTGFDQSNLSLIRGASGRVASNLDQLS